MCADGEAAYGCSVAGDGASLEKREGGTVLGCCCRDLVAVWPVCGEDLSGRVNVVARNAAVEAELTVAEGSQVVDSMPSPKLPCVHRRAMVVASHLASTMDPTNFSLLDPSTKRLSVVWATALAARAPTISAFENIVACPVIDRSN